jgi:hypothetical protein
MTIYVLLLLLLSSSSSLINFFLTTYRRENNTQEHFTDTWWEMRSHSVIPVFLRKCRSLIRMLPHLSPATFNRSSAFSLLRYPVSCVQYPFLGTLISVTRWRSDEDLKSSVTPALWNGYFYFYTCLISSFTQQTSYSTCSLPGCSSNNLIAYFLHHQIYEGRLQSSLTHLITPSRNFVEVRWRPPFRSTSRGKRCTSYNAPPTSRKRAADRWSLRNFLSRSSLFMVGKAQKSHEARPELNCGFGLEKVDRWNPIRTSAIQSRSRWRHIFRN